MKLTALVPMKANSSRVPGKNFRSIAGKPLFHWVVEALAESGAVSNIVINTDARALIEEAGLPDVSIPILLRDRPEALCGDDVSMNLVIGNDLENLQASHYLMTHTTNPLISADTFARAGVAYKTGLAGGSDSLFSVNRFQTRFYRSDGSAINHDPANLIPTQDLEPWYEENSCLYLFSRESFELSGARIGARPALFETPPLESSDIDEIHDWQLAEILLQHRASL
jgi:CMP-N-acetylneuraminic acid synthetase